MSSGGGGKKTLEEDPAIDDFRAAVREIAKENKKSIPDVLNGIFSSRVRAKKDSSSKEGTAKIITLDAFMAGCNTEAKLRKKRSDLMEVFEACDLSGEGEISLPTLIEFAMRVPAGAKITAAKYRKAVLKSYPTEEQIKTYFSSNLADPKRSKYLSGDDLHYCIEEILKTHLGHTEFMVIYDIIDQDGDDKISEQEFLDFMLEQSPDVRAILAGRSPNAIVDLKVSVTRDMDQELTKAEYEQVRIDGHASFKTASTESMAFGSFGHGQSLFYRRRKNGTCAGRLKPVVAVRLEATQKSSALVLEGFTCLIPPVSGQYIWIKRATSEEEEDDAIVDIRSTVGKMKDTSDNIHQAPGPGWSKIEGANFGKSRFSQSLPIFSQTDAFLWYLPAKAGSRKYSTTRRSQLKDEDRRALLCQITRTTLRNYVPIRDVKKMADPGSLVTEESIKSKSSPSHLLRTSQSDMANLYNSIAKQSWITGNFNITCLATILENIGVCVDAEDVAPIFYHFDVSCNGRIDRDEFIEVLGLTDYELDLRLDQFKKMVDLSTGRKMKGATDVRSNRALSDLFKKSNTLKDGVLSYEDLSKLMSGLEIFMDESELRKTMTRMRGEHDRVEESDFIDFVKKGSVVNSEKAVRIRNCANIMRAWIQRNSDSTADGIILPRVWKNFVRAHEKSTKSPFPGFLGAEDIYNIMARNSVRLDHHECKYLAFMMAPRKNGHITEADLQAFAKGSCRSFGELLGMLDKDIIQPLTEAYRLHQDYIRKNDTEDPLLAGKFEEQVKECITMIKCQTAGPYEEKKGSGASSSEIVSPVQVKEGVEKYFEGFRTAKSLLPSVEEWTSLAILTGDAVADVGYTGINIKNFMQNLCLSIAGAITGTGAGSSVSLEQVCRDLQNMLLTEAKRTSQGKLPNYLSVFQLFDTDHSGTITTKEFKDMLIRLHIVDGLTDNMFPKLIEKFDRKKLGSIDVKDFQAFCESGEYAGGVKETGGEELDEEYGIASNTPPVTISRNPDTDWLLWFLWKEAFKQDKADPEGVITELEAACTDNEITEVKSSVSTIPVVDFWSLLTETGLRGAMSKQQFDVGATLFVDAVKEGKVVVDRIDYVAFCSHIVRMGRAFNGILQERKKKEDKMYKEIKSKLFSELKSSGALERSGRAGHESLRFQKIMQRLDEDGDGKLSVAEFKTALKRIRLKCERDWSARMIRRLFDEFDKNKDGLLDTDEFVVFIESEGPSSKTEKEKTPEKDEDDGIFTGRKVITEHDLFKKVSTILLEMVPKESSEGGAESHIETVRGAVRRFFQRTDQKNTGIATEDRFRAFCRKSGLQDSLTASEVRRLIDVIRKKKGYDVHFVEYEKFCRLLGPNASSVPISKAEGILVRLQEAAIASTANGRSFMALCSLSDLKVIGKLSVDDLCHTFKMMGAEVTHSDVNAVKELLPGSAVDSAGMIDYREMQWLLQSTVHSAAPVRPDGDYFYHTHIQPPPPYQSPMRNTWNSVAATENPTRHLHFGDSFGRSSIPTPGGYQLSTPYASYDGDRTGSGTHGGGSGSERMVSSIVERVSCAVEEKSRFRGAPYSLLRQFEVFDHPGSGFVTLRTFQSTMDELNVLLSAMEINAILAQFGRPEDDRIDYIKFSRMIEQQQFKSGARGPRDTAGQAPYLNRRAIDKFLQLRAAGTEPRHVLEGFDMNRSGLISARKFKEAMQHMNLLDSDYQLSRAMEDFCNYTDRSMINYDDFCYALEEAVSAGNREVGTSGGGHWSGRDSVGVSASNRGNNASGTPRFRASLDENDYPPIKVSDSGAFTRGVTGGRSRYLDEENSLSSSLDRSGGLRRHGTASPRRPRSPPSKVGAAMWGSSTPLAEKGFPLEVDRGQHWCCPVCYYTENAASTDTCELCDCPNTTKKSAEFHVKEQCSNCTFLNGHFATECEMCSKPLSSSSSRSASVSRSRSSASRRDFD